MRTTCPTEEQEQRLLLSWAARTGRPELRLLHAIPNGGKRLKSEAARLQAMGVKPGVPDLCLPVPRGKYHGLYIELKRLYGGRVSPAQKAWLEALSAQGYKAVVCQGAAQAAIVIQGYLGGDTHAG